MKEGWEYKTIKDCCIELFAGGDVPKPDVSKNKTKYFTVPIYTNGVENEGLYGYTSNARVFEPAVTISARGTIGATFRRFIPFYPAIRLITAVPNKDVLSIDYLYYALKTLTVGNSGTSIPQLTIPNIKKIVLPVPPLSEQQSIVDYLDSAFAKIDAMKANAEKALNEAKALFQASLKEMLEPKEGWEEKTLGEIAVFSQGIQVDVNLQTEIYSPGKVRFLRIIDVTQGNVPPRYIDDPGERYYLKADEIAMVRYGTVGFVCYGFEGVIANNLFKVSIKDKSKLQSNYLQYFLKSDLFQSHIRKGVGGAALPAIKFGDIKHIMLGIPPLSEQQSIVAFLDSLKSKVDRLQENFDKISQECDALKQAILRQVFE